MKVLIYGNRKQDDEIYDVSTPEKEAATFLALFALLDEEWMVYEGCMSAKEEPLYLAAKAGDAPSAKKLLTSRKTYEYEEWHYGEVIDPTA